MNFWLAIPIVAALVWAISAFGIAFALRRSRAFVQPVRSEITMKRATGGNMPSSPEQHLSRIKRARGDRRVLIVGAGAVGCTLARGLHADGGYCIVGFIDDEIDIVCEGEFPILGGRDRTIDLVEQYEIDEVVLAYAPTWQQQLAEELTVYHPEVCVRIVPSAFEAMLRVQDVESFGDIALVQLVTRADVFKERLKRAVDIVSSLAGLIILAPVIGLVALLVRLTSNGPVIFAQERTGRLGKPFTLYKFRTMVQDAETETGPVLASGRNDSRLTPIGKWLRMFRIDEFPQFWNVLRGDMSLVGPRPERPFFVRQFELQSPAYAQRHLVRPGITGLAQVCGGYHTDARDKLRFDLIYVSHHSIWLDISILLRTILIVILPDRQRGES